MLCFAVLWERRDTLVSGYDSQLVRGEGGREEGRCAAWHAKCSMQVEEGRGEAPAAIALQRRWPTTAQVRAAGRRRSRWQGKGNMLHQLAWGECVP